MTVKPSKSVPKAISTSQTAKQLADIDHRLIRSNKFIDALTELMCLARDNLHDAQVWLVIGLVYTRMAHWQNAIGALETSEKLDPTNNQVKQLLSLALFSIGRKKEACELIDLVVQSGGANSAQWMLRAYIHGHTFSDPEITLKTAQDWGRRFSDPLTAKSQKIYIKDRSRNKKLKIGYVSGDLREHSVAFFMLPIFQNHDTENFEIYVYANGPEDDVTQEIKGFVANWRNVLDLEDAQLLKQIKRDEIDILVDLSGFTHGHRLMVFAQRAAPIQVTWLGYLLPLGMKAMDYRLVSRRVAPKGHSKFYSEVLVNMSGAACYTPPSYAPLCLELPQKRNGYPTFISLNNSGKITDEMLAIWAGVLNRIEDARLIIVVKESDANLAQMHMQPRVEKCGMPLERVSVLPQLPLSHFMELGYIADIALDTAPISGGTTTLHTLWMGLPIVTMKAERGVDACTANILAGKLSYFGEIAKNSEEYISAVEKLVSDEDRLLKIRSSCRATMESTAIMNYEARTKDIEKAFRYMWFDFLDGKKDYIDVDKYLSVAG